MPFVILLDLFIIVFFGTVIWTQIVIPLQRGTNIFPIFSRRHRRAIDELQTAADEFDAGVIRRITETYKEDDEQ